MFRLGDYQHEHCARTKYSSMTKSGIHRAVVVMKLIFQNHVGFDLQARTSRRHKSQRDHCVR